MALSPPSPSPSSSAVTLPRPGKSILKKPPPPQHSFFSLSRFSRLLPNQSSSPSASNVSSSGNGVSSGRDANGNGTDSTRESDANLQHLKRAHFFLPGLATVYPISAANPPSMVSTKEEKRTVEQREAERRRRVVRGNSYGPSGSGQSEDWWSMDKVESFYRECCQGREEQPHPGISAALKKISGANGRSLDLSGVQITLSQAATLSDVFSVEWGLRKLFLKECDLDEHNLKPILHALLIPNSLNFLSVASNKRLKAPAFKILGSFVSRSKNLQFLDLSMNLMDKKGVESIACALKPSATPGPSSGTTGADAGTGLVSLRMDDCALRPAALEILAQNVRISTLRNISLRHNRISASSAVALALMIKDYPDTMPSSYALQSSSLSSASNSPNSSSISLFSTLSPPLTPTASETPPLTPTNASSFNPLSQPPQSSPRLPTTSLSVPGSSAPLPQNRAAPPLPPPTHPANAPLQTTYTPYIPKSRRLAAMNVGANARPGATANARAVQNATRAPDPPNVPVITSSSGGGVVTRHAANGSTAAGLTNAGAAVKKASIGPSAALLDKVRALDSLPRLGELRTLDLRGNDIRTGITYVAQVLKRNRTLKVLNLSENKIDVQGLVAIAEALKYNLTLETLDLSKNTCSGPALDGIQSLRTAFTLNTSLKRLFLTGTALTSAGAIALAEFLPESTSLLHLDLTNNNLELAGVMALSGGLKANHVMRCLDLNIPPDDDEYARDILNTCVRNTEEAEKAAKAIRGTASAGKAVWGMIEESALAKTFKKGESKKVDEDLLSQAKLCLSQVEELLPRLLASSQLQTDTAGEAIEAEAEVAKVNDAEADEIVQRAKAALVVIEDVIQDTDDPIRIEELFYVNDSITGALSRVDEARSSLKSGTPPSSEDPNSGAITPRSRTALQQKGDQRLNGLRLVIPSSQLLTAEPEGLETPRMDKGKGRAAPEPVKHEPVTSPNIVLKGSDEEDEGYGEELVEEDEKDAEGNPVNGLSKVMVEEEGEVFRKGHALLTSKEMEGEFDGEELRIELLEAEVERPPPRALNFDEFDANVDQLPPLPASPSTPLVSNQLEAQLAAATMPDGLLSPLSPASATSSPSKPPPKPYIRRTHSASSASASPLVASPSLSEFTIKGSSGQLSPSIAQVQAQAELQAQAQHGNGYGVVGLGIVSREGSVGSTEG